MYNSATLHQQFSDCLAEKPPRSGKCAQAYGGVFFLSLTEGQWQAGCAAAKPSVDNDTSRRDKWFGRIGPWVVSQQPTISSWW